MQGILPTMPTPGPLESSIRRRMEHERSMMDGREAGVLPEPSGCPRPSAREGETWATCRGCAAGSDVEEPLSVRVCRAFTYATRDFEGMYRYDQLLAEGGDEDARMRLSYYEVLGEQGIAKLVAAK